MAPAPPQWAMIGGRAYCRFCAQVTCHRVRPRIFAGRNQIGGQYRGSEGKMNGAMVLISQLIVPPVEGVSQRVQNSNR